MIQHPTPGSAAPGRLRSFRHSSGWVALLASLTLFATFAFGQRVLEIKGFQTADFFDPPNETRMKSLLKGARARPLDNDRVLVSDVELVTFQKSGERDLIIRAPECDYNQRTDTATSAGPLHVQTADGRFSIEGEGFLWEKTNSFLRISNRVHTVIQPELMHPSSAPPRDRPSHQEGPVQIFAHRFEYGQDSGLGIYRDAVHVLGTNLDLTSEQLTLEVPVAETRQTAILKSVTAERDVAMRYGGIQATGQTAVYSPGTGLATITGAPAWRAEQRQGRGDELVLDRSNRVFQVNGHAWLRMPGGSMGSSGFLSSSNNPVAPGPAATNRFIDVLSDSYELRTNWAVFRNNVRLSEIVSNHTGGTLTCRTMTATFIGTNQLQQLVAEDNVAIQEEDKRFTGGKAVFTGTNGVLDLTINPRWFAGLREGAGDLARVRSQQNEMIVRGRASMRLPAEELGQGSPGSAASSTKPRTQSAGPQFADIFCQEYVVQPQRATFLGHVHAVAPARMDIVSEGLTVLAPKPGEKVLIAEQAVVFDLISEKGTKIHGTGDEAVYTNSITSTLTNDLLTLVGSPATLVTTNGTNFSKTFVLDRLHNQLISRGDYKVLGVAPAIGTNAFKLQKHQSRK